MLLEPPWLEIAQNEAFEATFRDGLGGLTKNDRSLPEAPPPSERSADTAKPSAEATKPSADTAKPSSETAKPRPDYGDSTFSSEPGLPPPGADYGDSAVLSKPGFHVPEPGFQSPEPDTQTAKPNRDSPARGGSQERLRCCAGLRGFNAKSSKTAVNPGGGNLRTAKPKLFVRFRTKKLFGKVTV